MSIGASAPADDIGFEAHRRRLFGAAYRILGSVQDAEDVVQDAWLAWRAADRAQVRDARAYLVRVVAHRALDLGTSAARRRETYVGPWLPEPLLASLDAPDDHPARDGTLRLGLVVLLSRLTPLERTVFVLREAFELPYDEVAHAVGSSPAACRKLMQRARARLAEEGLGELGPADAGRTAAALQAFGHATDRGDVQALVALLAERAVLVTDGGGRERAALRPIVGPERVAAFFVGLRRRYGQAALAVRPVWLNGQGGVVVWAEGEAPSVIAVELGDGGRIAGVYSWRNPDKLGHLPELR